MIGWGGVPPMGVAVRVGLSRPVTVRPMQRQHQSVPASVALDDLLAAPQRPAIVPPVSCLKDFDSRDHRARPTRRPSTARAVSPT
jgi:hypothetical protein